jgi:hypothetical protein
VEARIDNLEEKIKEMVASGMAYDVKVFKDGVEVHSVPVAIAGALAMIGFLPPARVLSLVGLAGANLAGYTFRFCKK